ncbi:hypothetical protein [Tahibacter sp.]|uniref:hypothetical protein n=1 Tax=Tahibacter sp. TaxID=2056211 RepID=UPI0028C4B508|nr:hypothetical protein [Tahibacter sp.]
MDLAEILKGFIRESGRGAIVLQGKWGRGKTHLWKYLWKEYCAEQLELGLSQRRYAYVSLFGIGSIKELKREVFQTHDEVATAPVAASNVGRGWLAQRWRKTKAGAINKLPLLKRLGADPEAKKVSPLLAAYEVIAENSLRNMLVCFDDVERRGASLRLLDFLGLVSLLSEERNCNVVVIANTESQEFPIDEWNMHREKVFRQEYTFDPSVEECVSAIMPPSGEIFRDSVRDALIELNVKNLRIVQRTSSLLAPIRGAIEASTLSERSITYIARSLALASYCYNGSGDGAPPLDLVVKHSAEGYTGVAANPELRAVWNTLANFRHYFNTEIDKKIIDFVRSGVIHQDSLVVAFRELASNDSVIDESQFYNDTWAMWRSSFNDNSADLLVRFERIAKQPFKGMTSSSASSVARTLRDLGRSDLASLLLRNWVESRIHDRKDDLSDRELNIWGDADPELVDLAREALDRELPVLSLVDAFALGSPAFYLPERLILAISRSKAEDLADYLEPLCNEGVAKSVYALTRLPPSAREPYVAGAREITCEALRLLARKSDHFCRKAKTIYPAAFPDND